MVGAGARVARVLHPKSGTARSGVEGRLVIGGGPGGAAGRWYGSRTAGAEVGGGGKVCAGDDGLQVPRPGAGPRSGAYPTLHCCNAVTV